MIIFKIRKRLSSKCSEKLNVKCDDKNEPADINISLREVTRGALEAARKDETYVAVDGRAMQRWVKRRFVTDPLTCRRPIRVRLARRGSAN